MINGFADKLVEAGQTGAHSVLEIIQTHERNSVHSLLQSAPDSIINRIQIWTVWWPDRRLNKVGNVLLQKLDCPLRMVRRSTIFLKYEVAAGFLTEEKSSATYFHGSNVLGSFVNEVCFRLVCLGYGNRYDHAFTEVHATFDETFTWHG